MYKYFIIDKANIQLKSTIHSYETAIVDISAGRGFECNPKKPTGVLFPTWDSIQNKTVWLCYPLH